ncbi:MAG: hypothetical protein HOE54_11075 [Gammaproteobacteria bacterium]|jgi:hypothetical protein|nr:hypothetical protein [Gammaproteobacteria bacterium]MBT7370884.1 hypothetical protein [Gammaproteobacteria bacterium]
MLIDTADELSISLSAAVQRSLLWNSLGKPVAALLIAVLLCQLAGLGEAMTLCMAICGFICGVLTCRTLPETSLEKISVN